MWCVFEREERAKYSQFNKLILYDLRLTLFLQCVVMENNAI